VFSIGVSVALQKTCLEHSTDFFFYIIQLKTFMQSDPMMPQNAVHVGSSLDCDTKLVSVSDRWKKK